MSYSRWMFSDWYVYPHVGGHIECDHVEGVYLQWRKGETLEEFIARAMRETLSKEAIEELWYILDENRQEMEYFIEHGDLPKEEKA